MKFLIIVFSILTILSAFFIAYFEYRKKRKMVFLGALLSMIFGILSFVFQQIQQSKDGKVIDEIEGYASGGIDNKPIVSVVFEKQKDSSYLSFFRILNFGKFPLKDIFYEISDSYTTQYNFSKENALGDFRKLDNDVIFKLNKYMSDHVDETNVHGTLANLPKSFGMKVYQGKIIKNTPALMYLIKLSWNNQNYTTIYNFSKTKLEDNYKMFAINLTGADGKKITELTTFFPLVPKQFWGDFPTKLDTIPKTYQFDSSK